MKILLTGASGFLGSNLSKYLFNHELFKVYNSHKIDGGWFCDLKRKDSVKMLLDKTQPDCIIHCAANSSPKKPENIEEFLDDHILSTTNLLEYCRENIRFIYISSVLVYGRFYPLEKPNSLYGACKLSCEKIIKAYSEMKRLQVNIIRPSSIVGKNTTYGLVYDIKQKLLSDNPKLELFNNFPGVTKPVVHIEDVCSCVARLVNYEYSHNNFIDCFPSDSISVDHIAQILMYKMGIKKEVVWLGDKNFYSNHDINVDCYNYHNFSLKYKTSREAIENAV